MATHFLSWSVRELSYIYGAKERIYKLERHSNIDSVVGWHIIMVTYICFCKLLSSRHRFQDRWGPRFCTSLKTVWACLSPVKLFLFPHVRNTIYIDTNVITVCKFGVSLACTWSVVAETDCVTAKQPCSWCSCSLHTLLKYTSNISILATLHI